MAQAQRHRGPDGSGEWIDPAAGLAFGHRRLAVIDPTPDGHQPMASADGRWVLNYNGEIYNHRELRSRLVAAGVVFRGHSDTEVLVEAVARWGLDEALLASNGMFALAVWDGRERRLVLARDRLGEKPLYYGIADGRLVFASELAPFYAVGFPVRRDPASIAAYLRYGCIPAPLTVYERVRKLCPGELVEFDWRAGAAFPAPRQYWQLQRVVEAALSNPLEDPRETLTRLHELLRGSVRQRMVADVPVGALLSGGVDSSLVVALMCEQSGSSPVRTFTIGMEDPRYDESAWAARVAAHLGVDHTEMRVTSAEAMAVIPDLPTIFDEPFADSSQIPTVLVSRLARSQVTVALTGDGGDELFTGYSRYLLGEGLWEATRRVPTSLRGPVGRLLTRLDRPYWDAILAAGAPLLPRRARTSRPGQKLSRFGVVLGADSLDIAYADLMSPWGRSNLPTDADVPGTSWSPGPDWLAHALPTDRLTALDAASYLPDDLLVKVDRAAMSASLETRLPLLDPDLVEFAWRVPQTVKLHDGGGKWPLRQLLGNYLPAELIDRPKTGFAVPLGDWLRGPLRDWCEDLLSSDLVESLGLHPEPVTRAWRAHLSGARDQSASLWTVLMLAAWDRHMPVVGGLSTEHRS